MNDTGPAKLPGLARVHTGNSALDGWIQAVSERLEVREGNRGNPYERVVTLRELNALGLDSASLSAAGTSKGVSVGGVMVQTPSGTFTRIPIDAFSDELRKTRLYRDLNQAINDATRFDTLPEELRNLLLDSIADEAAKRGADIQRLDKKIQSTTESLAYTVQEVTAAVQGAQAGVREAAYAAANANHATAGKVTQIQARLDGVGGVTIEESMTATADRVAGLAGEFMVKINAGHAVAGFGLAASEDPTGATTSAFIVQADDFGVVAPYTFSGLSTATPNATVIGQTWYQTDTKVSKRATATGAGSWVAFTPAVPFGVDTATNTTYINGNIRVGNGGDALSLLATNAAVAPITFIGSFASAPATASLKKNNVYKNTTNGNSYILAADGGAWVLYLAKGESGYTPVKGTDYFDGNDGISVKVQYSVDNSTWHDSPGAGDLYIRTGSKAAGASSYTYNTGVKFVPEFGVEYNDGDPGTSAYIHIKYSDDGTTFTASSGEVVGAYMGVLVNTTAADSETFSDYTWKKIEGAKGDKGDPGNDSTAQGDPGIRGTITTNIVGAWGSSSSASASAQITAVANSTGATPNYPIRGDIVYYTGGAKAYSGSAWVDATFTLDGSMLATGTIGAQVALDTQGYVKAVGASGTYSIQITAGSGGTMAASTAGSFNYGGGGAVGAMGFSATEVGAGLYGQGVDTTITSFGTFGYGFYGAMGRSGGVVTVGGVTYYGVGVIGQATGSNTNGTGVRGDSNSGSNSKAVHGDATKGGWAFYGTGPVAATGNITANYSDDRLKTRLGKIRNALDKVDTLDTFYYKPNKVAKKLGYKASREVGVSAQQVQTIMPEVVAPAPIDSKYLTVRYERLLPLVLAAIKELHIEVNKLKAAR